MIADNLKKFENNKNAGFSIIEIVIFVGIFSLLLVSAIGFAIRMTFTMQHNLHRQIASRYVEEAKEWLDGEREASWDNLVAKASAGGGTEYCVNNPLALNTSLNSIPTSSSSGGCGFTGIVGRAPSIFRRRLNLRRDVNTVTAVIDVSWVDEGVGFNETLDTAYSVWQ